LLRAAPGMEWLDGCRGDQFDALDDDALVQHLVDVAAPRRERLMLEPRGGVWIAVVLGGFAVVLVGGYR
jgi:hypothetical protein